jgi:hypothetical protein
MLPRRFNVCLPSVFAGQMNITILMFEVLNHTPPRWVTPTNSLVDSFAYIWMDRKYQNTVPAQILEIRTPYVRKSQLMDVYRTGCFNGDILFSKCTIYAALPASY